MAWPAIPGIILLGVVLYMLANHAVNNPDIVEDVVDIVLVRCEVSDLLYEKMVDVGLNQDHIATLDALRQGKEVAARDVEDVVGHVKHAVNVAKWGMACSLADN